MFTCTLRTTLLALGICPVSDVQCVSVSRVYATPRSVSSDSSRSGPGWGESRGKARRERDLRQAERQWSQLTGLRHRDTAPSQDNCDLDLNGCIHCEHLVILLTFITCESCNITKVQKYKRG